MLLECFTQRYSCRAYKDNSIEKAKLANIIEAARLSPSAKNIQPWKLVLIQDKQKLSSLINVCKQEFPSKAPLVIAVCCNNLEHIMSCGHPSSLADGFGMTMSILLQASAEGLGSCWLGAFNQEKAAELINLPEDYSVLSLISIGYADDNPTTQTKKSTEEIVVYDNF